MWIELFPPGTDAVSNDYFGELMKPSNSSDTWLPERRARYNAKRRQKDLELIFSITGTRHCPMQLAVIPSFISNVPNSFVKKYKRALKVHHKDLMRLDEKWQKEWDHIFEYSNQIYQLDGTCITPKCDKMIPHALRMLGLLKERIPAYRSKVISDLPPNFRDSYGELFICYMMHHADFLRFVDNQAFPSLDIETLRRWLV